MTRSTALVYASRIDNPQEEPSLVKQASLGIALAHEGGLVPVVVFDLPAQSDWSLRAQSTLALLRDQAACPDIHTIVLSGFAQTAHSITELADLALICLNRGIELTFSDPQLERYQVRMTQSMAFLGFVHNQLQRRFPTGARQALSALFSVASGRLLRCAECDEGFVLSDGWYEHDRSGCASTQSMTDSDVLLELLSLLKPLTLLRGPKTGKIAHQVQQDLLAAEAQGSGSPLQKLCRLIALYADHVYGSGQFEAEIQKLGDSWVPELQQAGRIEIQSPKVLQARVEQAIEMMTNMLDVKPEHVDCLFGKFLTKVVVREDKVESLDVSPDYRPWFQAAGLV